MRGLEEILRAHARVATAPLVPEVPLWLADAIVPVWAGAEAWRGAQVEPPFWAFAWPGSQALARHVLDDPAIVRGRVVLDFACGCGLAGIAAARAGAARVIAADLDPLAGEAARLNAALNGVDVEVRVGDATAVPLEADVVLAGDVCYERGPAAAILAWLRAAAGRATVLVADPGRAFAPVAGVEEVAAWDVPTSVEIEGVATRRARVMRVWG